jgi:hypothetical protein
MVEKNKTSPCDIVDFARYQAGRKATGKAPAISGRLCQHCGAALLDGESEEECSSASMSTPRARAAETANCAQIEQAIAHAATS